MIAAASDGHGSVHMLASSFLDCAGQKCMSLSSKVREELRIDDGKMRDCRGSRGTPNEAVHPLSLCTTAELHVCWVSVSLGRLGAKSGGQYGDPDAHDSCTLMPSISIRNSVSEWSLVRKASMG